MYLDQLLSSSMAPEMGIAKPNQKKTHVADSVQFTLISSISSSVAPDMGIARLTTSLPTYRSILPGAPPTYPKSASAISPGPLTIQPMTAIDTPAVGHWRVDPQSSVHRHGPDPNLRRPQMNELHAWKSMLSCKVKLIQKPKPL